MVLTVKPELRQAVRELCAELDSPEEKEWAFFAGLEAVVRQLGPRNKALLQKRDELQALINLWHTERPHITAAGLGENAEYVKYLEDIGYLLPEELVEVSTTHVDREVGELAGPQLVCPIDSARHVLEACNARWGSLYDALYASNALGAGGIAAAAAGELPEGPWSPQRAQEAVSLVDTFLSECYPLRKGTWAEVAALHVRDAKLAVTLHGEASSPTGLKDPGLFAGHSGEDASPSKVLLKKHGLHIELRLDRSSKFGSIHHAGIGDIIVESAITTVLDMEDSVVAVDAADKAVCYRNLAGVMRGDLSCTLADGQVQQIARDRGPYTPPDGGESFTLPGRAVVLVRNVGLAMYTDMVTFGGEEIPEHFVDAFATALCAQHDLMWNSSGSRGSVYILKPKMHGPEEVAFAVELFEAVEHALGLPKLTLKIGVMDEERRTTVNLQACISQAAQRIVAINTGVLDRVGDEIHTSMALGPVFPMWKIRKQLFLQAYEDQNVLCGLRAKLGGRAQIGKGMWNKPNDMKGMLKSKANQPKAGASCAWVPSPMAATIHALHYHQVDVRHVQEHLKLPTRKSLLAKILTPPIMSSAAERPSKEQAIAEVEDRCQSVLGYVVRWVERGIGWSRVQNLEGVELMEDRATLRVSSQLLSNWLRHGVVSQEEVASAMRKTARVVDQQHATEEGYRPMSPHFEYSLAFQAATRLVQEGTAARNGLTEPVLHFFRRRAKRASQRSLVGDFVRSPGFYAVVTAASIVAISSMRWGRRSTLRP